MKLSVIIVNYKVKHFLEVCLDSVFKASKHISTEVIVVDNWSQDDSIPYLKSRFPSVHFIANTVNLGFGKANNQAVRIAQGEYILFLNPDTIVAEDTFDKCIAYLDAHQGVGALGPRLIDGKGKFAPDAKKSFPTLSVAVFKTLGLHKLFPKNAYLNRYYAAHINEWETAQVEVLSGCCMFVRASILPSIGGAFDESFFMYCEDVDLNYRINKGGYLNMYYPEATVLHFKGESTKKLSYQYVKVFNDALITFVKKHYSAANASLFISFIKLGIALRGALGFATNWLKKYKLALVDFIVLFCTLSFLTSFWVEHIKNINIVSSKFINYTYPAYLLIWMGALYFNGVYNKLYKPMRVVRAMFIGSILCLAYYGLLPADLRYSRALIVLSGMTGGLLLLAAHELVHRLGIIPLTYAGSISAKAVVFGNTDSYLEIQQKWKGLTWAPQLCGHVQDDPYTLATPSSHFKQLLQATSSNEVVFVSDALSYSQLFEWMRILGPKYNYKIHISNSQYFIGSNQSELAGDSLQMDPIYALSDPDQLRNKRMIDLLISIGVLMSLPILAILKFSLDKKAQASLAVLKGKATWVGYCATIKPDPQLPLLVPGIVAAYHYQADFVPSEPLAQQLNKDYALHYHAWTDIKLVLHNLRFI
ncbi:MAG: glycosyltransferase family 2 protein [Bacteroidota bacterium]